MSLIEPKSQDVDGQSQGTKGYTGKHEAHMGILSCVAFIVLEGGFSILAFSCLTAPRQIPFLSATSSTVRSAFQTVSNVWHLVAFTMAASICAQAFSKEWAARHDLNDQVSKVTSGTLDRALYFFKSRATMTFRIAFAASIILILMKPTSSSTITLSPGFKFREETQIGLLSDVNLSGELAGPNIEGFFEHASTAGSVVKLEKLGGSPWGVSPPLNRLIPLPLKVNDTTLLRYQTDFAYFQHQCRWQAPDSVDGLAYFVDGQRWDLATEVDLTQDLEPSGGGSTIRQLLPPLDVSPDISKYNGTSIHLFLGGNSTIPVGGLNATAAWIDLSGLPTLYNSSLFVSYHPLSPAVDWVKSPLATLLICEPNIQLNTGYAEIIGQNVFLDPDSTVITGNDSNAVGNIHPDAASFIFTIALYSASNQAEDIILDTNVIDYINFNSIASNMFMREPRMNDWRSASGGVQPLSLDAINGLADEYKLAALKGFTTGYKPDSAIFQVNGTFSKVVPASQETDDKLGLEASALYTVLHIAMTTVESVLLLVLVVLDIRQHRLPFDLSHVRKD